MQLPIEDLCSLSSRSLQSPFTATVPASTEDVLLKGFQMLEMENDRIETAQQVTCLCQQGTELYGTIIRCVVLIQCQFVLQFFAWFAKLQSNMDQDENVKYRCVKVKVLFMHTLWCHTACIGHMIVQ